MNTTSRAVRSGLTLLEVLSVVAVIAVITAITAPVFASARVGGKRVAQISGLRQSTAALALYAEDYGGEPNWPSFPVARKLLGVGITCDPLDNWRASCAQAWDPLLGSYGYAMMDGVDVGFIRSRYLSTGSTCLVLSIFGASKPVDPFPGNSPSPAMAARSDRNYHMPDFLTVGRSDLSAARVPAAKAGITQNEFMSWSYLMTVVNVRGI